jgi:hypothetical protein
VHAWRSCRRHSRILASSVHAGGQLGLQGGSPVVVSGAFRVLQPKTRCPPNKPPYSVAACSVRDMASTNKPNVALIAGVAVAAVAAGAALYFLTRSSPAEVSNSVLGTRCPPTQCVPLSPHHLIR